MSISRRLSFLIPLLMLGALSCPSDAAYSTERPATIGAGGAVVVQNYYYALPGKADEVYRWRLHASEVRARLGLAVGRVMRRAAGAGGEGEGADLPDVVWECDYPDAQARAADVARLDTSKEFDQVQAHMQTLIRQFRRSVYTVSAPDSGA